jgi:hypothetical protein
MAVIAAAGFEIIIDEEIDHSSCVDLSHSSYLVRIAAYLDTLNFSGQVGTHKAYIHDVVRLLGCQGLA